MRVQILALAIICLVPTSGCDFDLGLGLPSASGCRFLVHGRVTTPQGVGIKRVNVWLMRGEGQHIGNRTKTDSNGQYSVEGGALNPWDRPDRVRFRKDGDTVYRSLNGLCTEGVDVVWPY